jgi:hypothetical protein
MQAEPAKGGDQQFAIVEWIDQVGQAIATNRAPPGCWPKLESAGPKPRAGRKKRPANV